MRELCRDPASRPAGRGRATRRAPTRLPSVHTVWTESTVENVRLPRGKEQRRKGGVGEQEAGVREPEGIEVRREDVASSEAEVDTEVDYVRSAERCRGRTTRAAANDTRAGPQPVRRCSADPGPLRRPGLGS